METLKFPTRHDFLFKLNSLAHADKVNYLPDNFDLYADSYKVAGDRLVKIFMKNPVTNEALMYPIVHLYRQYVEWKLKELIRRLSYLYDRTDEFPAHHRLNLLWSKAVDLIEKVGLDISKADLDNIAGITDEFHAMDILVMMHVADTSQNNLVMEVNIMELAEVMKYLSNVLNFACVMATHRTEADSVS